MSNNLVEELIERADIVDIIGRFVKLHKSGANYFGLCPFHSDTTPSMSVSPKKKIFKCFSCQAHGNVITFVQKYKKITYAEAIREVAKMAGYSDSDINSYFNKQNKNYNQENWRLFELNNDANEIFKALLFNDDNKQYLQYLLDRKLSKEIINKFDIGFDGKNKAKQIVYDLLTNKEINPSAKWNENDLLKTSLITINEKTSEVIDYFHDRITFPLKDKNGFIVGFIARDIKTNTELKYLTSRETTLFSKSQTLYNFDKVFADKSENLVVLEGNIDLISLYESGMNENAYSSVALMGTALTFNHVNMIKKIGCVKNVILWFDNDNAGAHSTIVNGLQFLKAGFNVVVVNNNTQYKDVNEILVNEGKDKVLSLLSDPDKPDFITYYIQKQLVDITTTNITEKVNDVYALINKYGVPLLWSKYAQAISKATALSIDDITTAYKEFASNRFKANASYEWNKPHVVNKPKVDSTWNSPIAKNLLKAYQELMLCVLLNPELAEQAYTDLEFKQSKLELANDIIYVIKGLAVETFNPNSYLDEEDKMIDAFYKNKKISSKSYEIIKNMIIDQKISFKDSSITVSSNKNKCKQIVDHINYYVDELMILQYKKELLIPDLNEEQKNKILHKIKELTLRVSAFKKVKKSKYHI